MEEVHSKAEIYRAREQSAVETYMEEVHSKAEIYRAREQSAVETYGGSAQ